MYKLLIKDIRINHWGVYLGSIIFMLLMYLATLPPTVTFFITIFAITLSTYSYDDKVSINRYLLSMPIAKRKIVQSRYLFSLIIVVWTLIVQFSIMFFAQFFFQTNLYMYNWRDITTLLGFALFMIAIFTPIIYFFKSLGNAMFTIFFLIGLLTMLMMTALEKVLPFTDYIIFNDIDDGFALLVEHYFPNPAYIILLLLSSVILYLSFSLSIYLFKKKDV